MEFFELLKTLMNPESIIKYGGIILLLIVVFSENGVFFAFWLPGDSLLFTTGLFCQMRVLDYSLPVVLLALFAASFLGYMFGYYFGRRSGVYLENRPDSLFFKRRYIDMARTYYDKYGGRTLVIGRFLPIIRTFAPIFAGMIRMSVGQFVMYNVVGGVLWVGLITCVGYVVGTFVPNAADYLHYVVVLLVIVTAIPVVNTYLEKRKERKASEGK